MLDRLPLAEMTVDTIDGLLDPSLHGRLVHALLLGRIPVGNDEGGHIGLAFSLVLGHQVIQKIAEVIEKSAGVALGVHVFDHRSIAAIQVLQVGDKIGIRQKAYVETVPVEVKDGKLDITFTATTQNPAINGIEILPAS